MWPYELLFVRSELYSESMYVCIWSYIQYYALQVSCTHYLCIGAFYIYPAHICALMHSARILQTIFYHALAHMCARFAHMQ